MVGMRPLVLLVLFFCFLLFIQINNAEINKCSEGQCLRKSVSTTIISSTVSVGKGDLKGKGFVDPGLTLSGPLH